MNTGGSTGHWTDARAELAGPEVGIASDALERLRLNTGGSTGHFRRAHEQSSRALRSASQAMP